MSDQPGEIQPMVFEKNPPPPGDEYEEIREQVRSFSCPLTSRAGRGCRVLGGLWHLERWTMNRIKIVVMLFVAVGD